MLVETRKKGSKGKWEVYAFQNIKSAAAKIKKSLEAGDQVRAMGEDIFAINPDTNTLTYYVRPANHLRMERLMNKMRIK